MPHIVHQLAPGPDFWRRAARWLIARSADSGLAGLPSSLVLVPTFSHFALLRAALAAELGDSFIPPQIRTLDSWLEQQPPDTAAEPPASATERLMALYASLRDLGWLKKLFAARRNTDLLPLAQTLVGLADELTAALLPAALAQPQQVEDRWHAALAQLSPRAAALLSDEAQLVWKLWQVERDERDPGVARHASMQRAAAAASCPLFWCSPWPPDALESAFLDSWSMQQPVALLQLDWSASAWPSAYAASWPELIDGESAASVPASLPAGVVLHEATGMEDEAQMAAQTIIDWIAAGRERIAVIPQDRVVARRLRALLERAQVVVSDETGWKLSTTRAAAVLHAWIELAGAGGDAVRLLDFLKSPFIAHDALADPQQRGAMEAALISAGPAAGWEALGNTLSAQPQAKALIDAIAREANRYRAARPVTDWVEDTLNVFAALGCADALAADKAGAQVLEMLARLARDCERLDQPDHRFSLSEWRVLVDLQMEQTSFVAPREDRRVMMVPLNGSTLREFDAAIVVGADAEHLPSRPAEVLFFANAVRRELGLETRESRQRQQLREFALLLTSCPEVVLSWQARRDGEDIKPGAWIQRLELVMESAGLGRLPRRRPSMLTEQLLAEPQAMPAPAAPSLLPHRLSASGYNSLIACPYQFFASRMLALSAPDEITALPERRDYGDWLHLILKRYHDALLEAPMAPAQRHALMVAISDEVFDSIIVRNPGALAYKMRWLSRCDAYVDWANAHESEGWTYASGETPRKQALRVDGHADGKVVELVGKLDRIDRNSNGELMVLDYKTTRAATLKSRLKGREDHQLAFYSLLLDTPPVRAAYVAVDDDPDAGIEPEDLDAWRDALREQLQANLSSIAQGSGLPAQGTGSSCEWCAMRGLCRKGAW